MEVAGLAIGLISLASLFQACFDACDKIIAWERFDVDLEDATLKLQIEQHRLTHAKHKLDRTPLQGQVEVVAPIILKRINRLLHEIESIIAKNAPATKSALNIAPVDQKTSLGLRRFVPRHPLRKIKWIAADKALLDERFVQLRYYAEAVLTLATSEAERAGEAYLLRHVAISSREDEQLAALVLASCSDHPDIARAAKVKQLFECSIRNEQILPENPLSPLQYEISVSDLYWAETKGLSHVVCKEWAPGTLERHSKSVPVLVEWRGPFISRRDTVSIQARLNNLCRLLRAMYESNVDPFTPELASSSSSGKDSVNFGMLECLGWTCTSDAFERIGMVFRLPPPGRRPRSLNDVIADGRRRGFQSVPELGARFDLAYTITTAVANVIAVGWVHRAVRSSNVMVFDANKIGQVYLVGLAYARDKDTAREFSNLPDHPDHGFYRPPRSLETDLSDDDGCLSDVDITAATAPTHSTTQDLGPIATDMFGLGIVLLEIGHWQTAERLSKTAKGVGPREFLSHSLSDCVNHLLPRCGKIYHSIVQRCLSPSLWESEGVEVMLADLLTSLKECKA